MKKIILFSLFFVLAISSIFIISKTMILAAEGPASGQHIVEVTNDSQSRNRTFNFSGGMGACPYVQDLPPITPTEVGIGLEIDNINLKYYNPTSGTYEVVNSGNYTVSQSLANDDYNSINVFINLNSSLPTGKYKISGTRSHSYFCEGSGYYTGYSLGTKIFNLETLSPQPPTSNIWLTGYYSGTNWFVWQATPVVHWESTNAVSCKLVINGDEDNAIDGLATSGSRNGVIHSFYNLEGITTVRSSVGYEIVCKNTAGIEARSSKIARLYPGKINIKAKYKETAVCPTSNFSDFSDMPLADAQYIKTSIKSEKTGFLVYNGNTYATKRPTIPLAWNTLEYIADPATYTPQTPVVDPVLTGYQYCQNSGSQALTILNNPVTLDMTYYFIKLPPPPPPLSCNVSLIVPNSSNHIVGNLISFGTTDSGAGASYKWEFGDGTSSTMSQPYWATHTYPSSVLPSGSYSVPMNVKLTVTSGSQTCVGTKDLTIFADKLNIDAAIKTSCSATSSSPAPSGFNPTFTLKKANAVGGITSYQYNVGLGSQIITATNIMNTPTYSITAATPPSGYVYCDSSDPVTYEDDRIAYQEKTITSYFAIPPGAPVCDDIVITPTPGTSPGGVLVENQYSMSASATGGNGSYSYAWDFGDGNTGTGQNVTHIYNVSEKDTNKTVSVTATSGSLTCSRSISVHLFAHKMNLDAAVLSSCGADPNTAYAMGSAASQVRIKRVKPGNYIDTVAPGIYDNVYRLGDYALSIDTTPTGYDPCYISPTTLNYNSTSVQSSKTATAYFVPECPGVYCQDPPSCTVSFDLNPITSGQQTTLSWSSTNDADGQIPYLCDGDIPDGIFQTSNGTYNVNPQLAQNCTLTVENSAGQQRTCADNIDINSPPDASLNLQAQAMCQDSTSAKVVLTWNPSAGATSYDAYRVIPWWPDAHMGPTSNTTITDSDLDLNRAYEYYVTASNDYGTSDESEYVLVTTPSTCSSGTITASIQASPNPIYSGQSSALTWSSSGATSCAIDQGIGSVCSSPAACDAGGQKTVSPIVTTPYAITCVNGGLSATDQDTVVVNPPGGGISCTFSVNPASGNKPLTVSTNIIPQGSGVEPYSYAYWCKRPWNSPNGTTKTGSCTYPSEGTYELTGHVTDATGKFAHCESSVLVEDGGGGGGGLSCVLDPALASGSSPVDVTLKNTATGGSGNYEYKFDYEGNNVWTNYQNQDIGVHTYYNNVPNPRFYYPSSVVRDKDDNTTALCNTTTFGNPTTVTVDPPVVSDCTFTALHYSIRRGDSPTLYYSCSYPLDKLCTIDQNVLNEPTTPQENPVAITAPKPSDDTTYTLTCNEPGHESIIKSLKIKVGGFLPILREIIPR